MGLEQEEILQDMAKGQATQGIDMESRENLTIQAKEEQASNSAREEDILILVKENLIIQAEKEPLSIQVNEEEAITKGLSEFY